MQTFLEVYLCIYIYIYIHMFMYNILRYLCTDIRIYNIYIYICVKPKHILCAYIYIYDKVDSTSICKPFRTKPDLADFGKQWRLRWSTFFVFVIRKICQECTGFILPNGSSSFPKK